MGTVLSSVRPYLTTLDEPKLHVAYFRWWLMSHYDYVTVTGLQVRLIKTYKNKDFKGSC